MNLKLLLQCSFSSTVALLAIPTTYASELALAKGTFDGAAGNQIEYYDVTSNTTFIGSDFVSQSVWDLDYDTDGNLYFARNDGVFRNSLSDNVLSATLGRQTEIAVSADGTLALAKGTFDGAAGNQIEYYDVTSNTTFIGSDFVSQSVWDLDYDTDGNLYFARNDGVFRNSLSDNVLSATLGRQTEIAVSADGTLALAKGTFDGAAGNQIEYYDVTSNTTFIGSDFVSQSVWDLDYDTDGNLYFARNDGVFRNSLSDNVLSATLGRQTEIAVPTIIIPEPTGFSYSLMVFVLGSSQLRNARKGVLAIFVKNSPQSRPQCLTRRGKDAKHVLAGRSVFG